MKKTKSLRYHQSLQFALVAGLPVMIMVILVWLFLLPAMRSDTGIRHQGIARSIAGQVSSHVFGGQRQLAALADFLKTRDGLSERQVTALLDSQCGEGELFETIYISSSRQQLVLAVGLARSRRSLRRDLLGLDLSGRRFVLKAGNPEKPVWSETFMSTVSRRLAVALTIPLGENLITAEITLDNLSSVISQLPGETGFLTYVIDHKGRIVADSQQLHWGQRLNDSLWSFAVPKHGGQIISGSFERNGTSYLGTVVAINDLEWKVLVAQPTSKAYSPLRSTLKTFILGLSMALILALFLSWNRAKRLSRIFRAYGEKAGAIADGRYDEIWPSSAITELNRLGQSLKHMAGMIDQREKKLVENKEEMRNLIANVPGILYEFSGDAEHPEFNDAPTVLKEKTMDLLGINWHPKRLFNDFVACLPREDQSRFIQSVQKAVDKAIPWHYEGRFIKPAGEEIWIECSSQPRKVCGKVVYYGLIMDSTPRKELEESLRLTQFIFNKAPIGIWRMGAEGKVLDVNEEGCTSLGYSREELCRMSVFDFDPAMNSERLAHQRALLEEAGSTTIESLHRRRNGDIFPIQVIQKMVRFEDQDYHVAFVQDITQRKQAEEDLRNLIHQLEESEERFKALHNASFGGIMIHDKGIIIECNQGLSEMTGYSVDELIGMDGMLLFPEKSRELVMDMIVSGYEKPYEAKGLRKNGEGFPIRLEARNVPYKGKQVRTLEFRDITEQKNADEELRRLKNYLSNIIDSMPSVLVGVDHDIRVTQWNRQAQQATGLNFEEAGARLLTEVFPHLADKMEQIKTAIRERRVISAPKIPVKTKQETRFEDVTIFPLTADGVEGAVIRVDDITEQVQLEEMMIQSEKMMSVGGLAAGMAHEINNPLAAMIQTANVMKSRLENLEMRTNLRAADEVGVSVDQIRAFMEKRSILRMLDAINESGRRVAGIVNNMLNFARKSDSAFSTHHPAQLIDKVLELAATDYNLKEHYDFKAIKIIKEYEENLPMIPCEESKIQQVLLNILGNGAQAMQSQNIGSDYIPCFILRLAKKENMLRIEIQDNGPGMDEATQSRIFEPFFTTKPVGVGTGLGLSVSYFIITHNHCGTMDVVSSLGKGSNFIIRLPLERNQ